MLVNRVYRLIKKSGLFDDEYYLKTYIDVQQADVDPLKHFILHGWKEGRNPSQHFDTNFYLKSYPDVKEAGINPLLHYILDGYKEGRKANLNNTLCYNKKYGMLYRSKKFFLHLTSNINLINSFILETKNNGFKSAILIAKRYIYEYFKEENILSPVFNYNDSNVYKKSAYKSWQEVNSLCKNRLDYLFYNFENCIYRPKISIIIPVYNPLLEFFVKAIDSVLNQLYNNWEICIVDDKSSNVFVKPYIQNLQKNYKNIKVSFNEKNSHISVTTNNAVQLSEGDYLVFLDQDDELTNDALIEIVLYLNKHRDCQILYSDDDKIDIYGNCFDPQFKPDWSPEYLLSFMYCGHLKCIKRTLYIELNGFRQGFEGSQDFDLFLRASEVVKYIGHIQRVLYHWRVVPGSTAAGGNEKKYSFDAGVKAVQEALDRRKVNGKAYHPKWALKNSNGIYDIKFPDDGRSVGIIIPTKNGYKLLKRCVDSLAKTTYQNYKIYIIDNGSDDLQTLNFLKSLTHCVIINIASVDGMFNFSYINNVAVKYVNEELILFLNNDTEVISPNWLSQMVGYMQISGVGSVGAKLLFPDNRIQHAGIVHGIDHGFPITSGRLLADWEWGYLASTVSSKNFAAVTAACMLTSKKVFEEMGGFNENEFSVAFNDCDYGYRLYNNGYRNVLAHSALLYHYEGSSRGHGDKPSEEYSYIKKYSKWKDPYYNLNLSNNCSDYSIASKSLALYNLPKIKVLMVTHNLNLEGAPKSFYEIVKGLKKNGVLEVVVISHVDGPLKKLYTDVGLEVNIIKDFRLFSMTEESDINKFIDAEVNYLKTLNIDLIYGNTIEAFWAMLCAKKMNLPCVWNIRESEEPFSSYNHNLIIKKHMIETMKYPYKIIFVANATQAVYEPLNTQNNFMTIYNGFDEELAKNKTLGYDRTLLKKELRINDNELSVLIIGTVCERKGQKDLIKAISIMNDSIIGNMRFFIVGDRKSLEYSKEMHQLINSLPNNKKNRITVVDETPETYKYYIVSDVFVCSSRIESFPKVIQEAMFYNLAIITTPVYGIVEQVKDKISALYYQPDDINTLSKHLEALSKDEILRKKLSLNAKTSLNIFPNIEEMASQYEEVFKEAWLSGGRL